MSRRRALPWLALGALALLGVWFTLEALRDPLGEEEGAGPRLPPSARISEAPRPKPAPPLEAPPAAQAPGEPVPASEPAGPPARLVPEVRPADTPPAPGPPRAGVLAVEPPARPAGLPFEARPYGPRGASRARPLGVRSVEVPGGWAWIGTPQEWLEGYESAADGPLPEALFLEAPRHRVLLPDFRIDRRESTNQEWWEYLVTLHRARETTRGGERLGDLARRFLGPAPWRSEAEWRGVEEQLLEANRAVLDPHLGDLVVPGPDGRPDAEATFDRQRERELPADLTLEFYRRPPPLAWPGARFEEHLADHPVHGVSGLDAVDFALWQGAHLPTEQEWEYAVRGADGWVWPWGNDLTGMEGVVGGRRRDPGIPPRTVPAHLTTGAETWVGLVHAVGNVREWTGSFLERYPEGVSGHPLLGQVLVLRGGSAVEQDPWHLRPALRGWVPEPGREAQAAPHPWRPLPFAGVRLAYPAADAPPGASRLRATHLHARAFGVLDPVLLAEAPWAGLEGVLTEDLDPLREDPDAIGPGVKGCFLAPLVSPARLGEGGRGPALPLRLSAPLDLAGLAALTRPGPLLLGLLHSDLPILDAWEPTPPWAAPPDARLKRATAPPGTWLLGLWHETPVLVRPDLGAVYLLERSARLTGRASVLEGRLPPDGRPRGAAGLRLIGSRGLALELTVPASVRPPDRTWRIHLRLRLALPAPVVAAVPEWTAGAVEDR